MGVEAESIGRALPFYGSMAIMSFCYLLFLAPIWDRDLYTESWDMSVRNFRNVISAGTLGTMLTFIPGELVKSTGPRHVLLGGLFLGALGYSSIIWGYSTGHIVHSEGWLIVIFAFCVGQGAGWMKLATLATIFDTCSPACVARCFGFLFASFELAACLWTMLTLTWTGSDDLLWMSGLFSDAESTSTARHLPIIAAGLILSPALYTLPANTMADERDLNLDRVRIGFLIVFGLCTYCWTQFAAFCPDWSQWGTKFEDFLNAPSLEAVWISVADCWTPYLAEAAWAASFGTVLTWSVTMTMRYGWLESAPPSSQNSKGMVVHGDGSATRLYQAKTGTQSAMLMVVIAITIGVSQAIGNNLYFLSEIYQSTFLGLNLSRGLIKGTNFLKIEPGYNLTAGAFLFSKMIGSYMAGQSWDRNASQPEKQRSFITSIPAVLTGCQVLFGVVPYFTRDSASLLFGMVGTGWALGAMTTMVPILALEWYGRYSFITMFSILMGSAALGLSFFFNVLEFSDWNTHYTSSGSYLEFDDAVGNATTTRDWGGCKAHPACFRLSFFIQAVFCAGATVLSHRMQQLSEELPLAMASVASEAKPLLDAEKKTSQDPDSERID